MIVDFILLRCLAVTAAGFLLYFLSCLPADRQQGHGRWLFPSLAVVGWFMSLIGALAFGETILRHDLDIWLAGKNVVIEILAASLAVLAPVYAATIVSQVLFNAARKLKGEKPLPLEWIRKPTR